MSLADDYLKACGTPSDIYEHLPVFVETCVEMEARTVIELGTRGGVSTIAWLYGLEQTDGHLWSVDIDPAPKFEHDRWTFLHGNDLTPGIFGQLPTADIVFIDTSHMYVQTLAELNLYRWKVRPGGIILLHDTELARPEGIGRNEPSFPVRRAVEEFCHDEGLTFTNRPNCFGLGRIEGI